MKKIMTLAVVLLFLIVPSYVYAQTTGGSGTAATGSGSTTGTGDTTANSACYPTPNTPDCIIVSWQQSAASPQGALTGQPTTLTSGANVNMDILSRLRIHVTGIPDQCSLIKMEYIEYYYLWSNQLHGPVPFTMIPHQPAADSDWLSVPVSYFNTWYQAKVTFTCQPNSAKVEKTSDWILTATDKTSSQTVTSQEQTDTQKTSVDASGQVKGSNEVLGNGGSGVVKGDTSASSGAGATTKTVLTKTSNNAQFDPVINHTLITYTTIPNGWTFDIDPKQVTLGANDSADVSLIHNSPTKGYVIFAIKAVGPNNNATSRPMIFIAQDPPVLPIQVRHIGVGTTDAQVWYNATNGRVLDMNLYPNNNTLSINLKPNGDGNLQLLLFRGVINSSSPLQVSMDGANASSTEVDSNDMYRIINVPFHSNSSNINVMGTHVVPEFGSLAGIIITISIIGVVLISRKFNYRVL